MSSLFEQQNLCAGISTRSDPFCDIGLGVINYHTMAVNYESF